MTFRMSILLFIHIRIGNYIWYNNNNNFQIYLFNSLETERERESIHANTIEIGNWMHFATPTTIYM